MLPGGIQKSSQIMLRTTKRVAILQRLQQDLYVLFVANRLGMKVQSFPVFFAKREFGEAKGGGSLKGKYKLIKRTFAYIFQMRKDIKQGKR